mgnify:CR=1 FL=1
MDNWLNEDLKQKVRKVFETRYEHPLSDTEVIAIAKNLTSFMDHFLKFKWRLNYGTQQ